MRALSRPLCREATAGGCAAAAAAAAAVAAAVAGYAGDPGLFKQAKAQLAAWKLMGCGLAELEQLSREHPAMLVRAALLDMLADRISRNNPKHHELKHEARHEFESFDRKA